MTAIKRRRVGSMSVHALQAQAASAPDLAPLRKPLRDYLAGPRRSDLGGAKGLDATAEKPVA